VLNGNRVIAIRARARRGWSLKKIARVFGVSRNTIRRYTRQDEPSQDPSKKPSLDARQELDLVRLEAHRWNTPDPDELESELTLKLVEIYPYKPVVDNWETFLITALKRTALNWLRSRKRRERRVASSSLSPSQEGEHGVDAVDIAAVFHVSDGGGHAIKRMRKVLPPFLRRVWDALIAENFNQTRAAKRLGVHRNTVHNAIRRIRIILKQHGF
jgi:DNA-directed RNA polymerase specialized sigma24 family protein